MHFRKPCKAGFPFLKEIIYRDAELSNFFAILHIITFL
ncbi:hypothetical protein KIS4809_0847 [Bacillus sp. ZZV12-4809]|nr:hypothetical protein KIS4809_0847 [Bacillus sp. ZZV12-4809]